MSRFDSHFKFTEEDVIDYIKETTDLFDKDAKLQSKEIGDGNINYIYKVWDENNKSVVVKQADELLRTSQRPLDVDRNRIEAEVLELQGKLSGGMTPTLYKYDPNVNCIIMEDISRFDNLRQALLERRIFPKFADQISTFMVKTLLNTTDLVLNPDDKKDNVRKYINKDLCEISEDLVFTEPYNDYKGRNIVLDENLSFVKENVYDDKELNLEAAKLKDRFKNYSQALIHGDLHSGSIFITEDELKVIDPEFAFYGPMGYDVGNVIGNLFFSLTNAYVTEDIEDEKIKEFIKFLEESIRDIYDLFIKKFKEEYKKNVTDPLSKTDQFLDWYLSEVLSDTAGVAGLEIMRRVVGDSKVIEITNIEDIEKRVKLERILILTSKDFILNREKIKTGQDFLDIFNKYNK
ncbi:MAG TPA: S-methyl-5-thioribose kinase [Tissierellaceae bacterium]